MKEANMTFAMPFRNAIAQGKSIIPADDISFIFDCFVPIIEYNTKLYEALLPRLEHWNKDSLIADVFCDLVCFSFIMFFRMLFLFVCFYRMWT